MKRMLVAQILWASVMVALVLWTKSIYSGCVTPPLVAEYGSSNVICPDGTIMAPLSSQLTTEGWIWVVGFLFIFAVRWWYIKIKVWKNRPRKVRGSIGFR